jgi:hypothetical protein
LFVTFFLGSIQTGPLIDCHGFTFRFTDGEDEVKAAALLLPPDMKVGLKNHLKLGAH